MARKFALRKLIELRISRGLSQRGLAELIDTSGVTVSRWERGATEPTPYNVSQLAKVFGVLPQVFYDDTISIISFNSSVPVYTLSNGKKEEKGLIGVPDGMNIDFAIVADDSLEPEIREYSYLLFRKTKEPEHNKIFVIEVNESFSKVMTRRKKKSQGRRYRKSRFSLTTCESSQNKKPLFRETLHRTLSS